MAQQKIGKPNRFLPLFAFSILIFQVFFLVTILFFYDVITINPSLKSFTREYWNWYTEIRVGVPYESTITSLAFVLKPAFSFIFIMEFLYLLADKAYRTTIGKKNFILGLVVLLVVYLLCFFWIKYQAEHYRLFMTLISTELFSLLVAYQLWQLRKRSRLRQAGEQTQQ